VLCALCVLWYPWSGALLVGSSTARYALMAVGGASDEGACDGGAEDEDACETFGEVPLPDKHQPYCQPCVGRCLCCCERTCGKAAALFYGIFCDAVPIPAIPTPQHTSIHTHTHIHKHSHAPC